MVRNYLNETKLLLSFLFAFNFYFLKEIQINQYYNCQFVSEINAVILSNPIPVSNFCSKFLISINFFILHEN